MLTKCAGPGASQSAFASKQGEIAWLRHGSANAGRGLAVASSSRQRIRERSLFPGTLAESVHAFARDESRTIAPRMRAVVRATRDDYAAMPAPARLGIAEASRNSHWPRR